MQISITPASLELAPALAALSAELGYPVTVVALEQRLQRLLASDQYAVLVAQAAGEVHGWLVVERRLSLEAGEKAEITGLVVSAAVRRQGVGAALVAAAEGWAGQQGLELLVVRSNVERVASHRFYPALGFVPSKTTHVYAKRLRCASGQRNPGEGL